MVLGPVADELIALLLIFVDGGATVRVVCSEVALPIFLNRQAVLSTQSLDDDTTVDIWNSHSKTFDQYENLKMATEI